MNHTVENDCSPEEEAHDKAFKEGYENCLSDMEFYFGMNFKDVLEHIKSNWKYF